MRNVYDMLNILYLWGFHALENHIKNLGESRLSRRLVDLLLARQVDLKARFDSQE